MVCCLVFCQLDTSENYLKGELPLRKMLPLDWLVSKSVEHFLAQRSLWEGRAHHWQCHCWTGSPGRFRNVVEYEAEEQAVFLHGFYFSSFLQIPALVKFLH